MDFDSDIVIAGGGLNGPALALALAGAGLRVTLVDPAKRADRKADDFDGRAYALAHGSRNLLAAVGVWPAVADKAQPILHVQIGEGHAGQGASPFSLDFDHAEIEEGPMGFMVEDRHLRPALLDALDEAAGIDCLRNTVTDHEALAAGVRVTLASGQQIMARLLVGCDGRKSSTAQRTGITRQGWDYGQTALVCAIDHERPHRGTAHQLFLPGGPFAILPLQGNRSSIVWSEERAQADALAKMDDTAFLTALRPRFGDFLGQIGLAGARFSYPLNLTLAQAIHGPRVALVGDAAHGVHPIAGQGLNLGLRDVAALAEVIVDAKRRGEDLGTEAVLSRYAGWRRFDSAAIGLGSDVVNRVFSSRMPAIRAIGAAGLSVTNALPGLRRRLIREAAGLSGDRPRLLQAKPL
ncbi:2-octaprenyl-6-methoxyphenyl hydroxylase [Actibacterium mucosum KCTC 23349]|uniref:2-octaprenyl-6-methoxyphenyl hydroxylase n=1 Tax=Actibacterium mucosum KCTC 23349 TaxID=1454373 RepID=A0A037ZP92_9RHOB|nr:FAD-dependent monooxygenase [Actibacterium mucosum]KAJ57475.1 2-octaprenyl-6-methoxyphenyl hydroxylase [Actibacterium mucosum KCTC 23349]